MDTNPDNPVIEKIAQESALLKDSGKRKLLIVCVVLFVLCLGSFSYIAWDTYRQNHQQAVRATNILKQLSDACADPQVDTGELSGICTKADKAVDEAPPSVVPNKGDKGDQGELGPVGPSGAPGRAPSFNEIYQAVRVALGTPVSRSLVQTAVAQYCASRNQCRGLSGLNGTNGTNGVDGKDGTPGAPGKDGTDGKDGVPFTIIFTVDSTTVTCTVTSPEPVTCSSDKPGGGPPTSTPTVITNP